MLVYKYYSQRWGLEALKDERLKITTIDELNDPFEFAAVSYADRDLREVLRNTKNKLFANKGLISFSKYWSNPVVWSHYADCHKGICLGFEASANQLVDVNYEPNRLVGDLAVDNISQIMDIEFQKKLIATKYKHWEYENESRMFVSTDTPDRTSGLYFLEHRKVGVLKTVILGANYVSGGNIGLQEQLNERGVDFTTARLSFQSFSVVPQRKKSLWKTL